MLSRSLLTTKKVTISHLSDLTTSATLGPTPRIVVGSSTKYGLSAQPEAQTKIFTNNNTLTIYILVTFECDVGVLLSANPYVYDDANCWLTQIRLGADT